MRLQGKTVLVTAAGQGMGRASALAMAGEGANVLATDIDAGLMADLPAGIARAALDVTDAAAVEAYVVDAPPLDGLFNCAGMVHHGTILDVTDDVWAKSMDLNVTSMVRLSRLLLPNLIDRATVTGSTSILNMSSMASSLKGFVNRAAYGATKAAVIGLTKSIAADFVKQGIQRRPIAFKHPHQWRLARIDRALFRYQGLRVETALHRLHLDSMRTRWPLQLSPMVIGPTLFRIAEY